MPDHHAERASFTGRSAGNGIADLLRAITVGLADS
jgi:hypothetical protein